MKIIFAKHLGFCFGAREAIEIAEKAIEKDPKPVQFLGSLLHNEKVVKSFQKRGVKFINALGEAEPGTLIIQAHGIAPLPKKINKNLLIRDATCPLVRKVQLIAKDLQEKGYQVVIFGDKEHSETKGIKGYAQNKAIIIGNEAQAKKLKNFNKIGLIPQTTQDLERFKKIIKILKGKTKELKHFNTICPEVMSRQKELTQIIKKTDGVLVIGSKSSANTKRLVEKIKQAKKPVWWTNSPKDVKKATFEGISVLGVVSGTSTPDWLIQDVTKKLKTFQ